jgi:predicted transcriptional regulator
MHMRYRSRIEIISRILEIANGGNITKSKILYQSFLSYDKMKEYLEVLTKTDLISYDLDTHTFKTTEKGLRFLDIYNQMDDMIKAPQVAPIEQQ